MVKDCMEVFEKEADETKKKTDRDMVLDSYIPFDGDYLIIKKDGSIQHCKIEFKKGELHKDPADEELYEKVRFYDYHSRIINTNKPISDKQILSCSYLSFIVKWERLAESSAKANKLTPDKVNRYFDALKNPGGKKTKKNDIALFQKMNEFLPEIDKEKLDHHRNWILDHLFKLEKSGIEFLKKNYLKIFFEDDPELYLQEETRYVFPRIFLKNDYNEEIEFKIYGVPNDSMSLDAKKPGLEHKTRKTVAPCLIAAEEALQQRAFFDYLQSNCKRNKPCMYIDTERNRIYPVSEQEIPDSEFTGYMIRAELTKSGVNIVDADILTHYSNTLMKPFLYENVLSLRDDYGLFKEYTKKSEILALLNKCLFSFKLFPNFFRDSKDISINDAALKDAIVCCRNAIRSWLYKDKPYHVADVLADRCWKICKTTLLDGELNRAGQQLSLIISVKNYLGGDNMERNYPEIRDDLRRKINSEIDAGIGCEKEYYYCVGQIVRYFISLKQKADKKHILVAPYLNCSSNKVLRALVNSGFTSVAYTIDVNNLRFNRMMTLIANYDATDDKVDREALMAGYIANCLIYEKAEKETEKVEE